MKMNIVRIKKYKDEKAAKAKQADIQKQPLT
jgi:hypothetical protein